ncbi:MAG: LysR family transcriptional regulator [Sandaracinaceae bacterium]
MEHLRRLYRVWNWLPAFRAVAETEHLPTASEMLGLTPSALSRAIKQLEDELGQQLFRRVGRRLELSPAGDELLAALRLSMSRLDRGLSAASTSQFLGPVRVNAPEPFASAFVIRALDRLVESHPLVVPHLSAHAPATAQAWVSDRRLDLAVLDDPTPDESLVVHRLGEMKYGVYCGEAHPLFGEETPPRDDVLRFSFVAPPPNTVHPWPREHDREVGMVVTDIHLALEVCASGRFLALLPDVVARGYRGRGNLRRLPVDIGATRPVYVVHRKSSAEGPVLALLDELQDELAILPSR